MDFGRSFSLARLFRLHESASPTEISGACLVGRVRVRPLTPDEEDEQTEQLRRAWRIRRNGGRQ